MFGYICFWVSFDLLGFVELGLGLLLVCLFAIAGLYMVGFDRWCFECLLYFGFVDCYVGSLRVLFRFLDLVFALLLDCCGV